jgi:hypothetical protein
VLRFVVANIRNQVLEAVVKDRTGQMRKIRMGWQTRDQAPPPATWHKTVYGEVEFQLEQEHRGGLPE